MRPSIDGTAFGRITMTVPTRRSQATRSSAPLTQAVQREEARMTPSDAGRSAGTAAASAGSIRPAVRAASAPTADTPAATTNLRLVMAMGSLRPRRVRVRRRDRGALGRLSPHDHNKH